MCCVFAFLPPMQPAFSLRRCSARISANEYNLRHLDSRSHVLLRRVTRVHSDVLTSLIRYKMHAERGQGHRVIPPVHSTWMENERVVEQRHSICNLACDGPKSAR